MITYNKVYKVQISSFDMTNQIKLYVKPTYPTHYSKISQSNKTKNGQHVPIRIQRVYYNGAQNQLKKDNGKYESTIN